MNNFKGFTEKKRKSNDEPVGSYIPKIKDSIANASGGIASAVDSAAGAIKKAAPLLGNTNIGAAINSYYNKKQYNDDIAENDARLKALDAEKPGKYQESDRLLKMYEELEQQEKTKPEYTSKYGDRIDAVLSQLEQRGEFKYDFNTDPMWNSLKDQYQRNAMLGMKSAMGEAANLTGGYGSSYSQAAGQQMYQQNISEMTDIIPQLADSALNRWQANGSELRSNLAALQNQESLDFSKFESELQQYNQDRSYIFNKVQAMSEDEFNKYLTELQTWQQDRSYYAAQKQQATANLQFQQQLDENRRQFNQQMLYNYVNMGVGAAVDLTTAGMSAGVSLAGIGVDAALGAAKLKQSQKQFDADDAYRYAALAQDQRQYDSGMKYKYDALAQDQKQYDSDLGYKYAALAQDQRQFNASDAYKYAALAQDQRQYDSDLKYKYAALEGKNSTGTSNKNDGLSQRGYNELIGQLDQRHGEARRDLLEAQAGELSDKQLKELLKRYNYQTSDF